MQLELKDEKGFTGLFIELPLEKLKEDLGLGNASSEIAAHLKGESRLRQRLGR